MPLKLPGFPRMSSQKPRESRPRGSRPVRFITPGELSFHAFSYPFGDPVRVRQALGLELAPLLGEEAAETLINPVVMTRDREHSRGFALVLPRSALADDEENRGYRLFPAPLALGKSLSGNGLAVWADERCVCAVLWNDGIPVFYRCTPREQGEPSEVIDWISRTSAKPLEVRLLDVKQDPCALEILAREAEQTFVAYPPMASLDLSIRQVDSNLRMENLSSRVKPALAALLLLGLLFDAAAGLFALSAASRLKGFEQKSVELYREVFDSSGPVRDPLSQARARLAAVSGTGGGSGLTGALAILGQGEGGSPEGVVLDTLRLSDQGTELTGKGESVEKIRAFQKSLEGRATPSLEDLQQLPGGGFRFKVTLR